MLHRCLTRYSLRLALVLGLALSCTALRAQVHEARQGAYLVRSSTVASQTFDAATARLHGIEPAPTRAVLNVVVLRVLASGDLMNIPAETVRATVTNLLGANHSIDLRPAIGNGMVSYIGAYTFAPREVLNFEIIVRPEGSREIITLAYHDRIWVP